ncbi:MAG: 50S ribosomal protein L22 [Clostridia bacterium]|nr:50S ribosomal protein L22 [Clostridia bacterium]
MERKVMSKDEVLARKDELLALYSGTHRQHNKPVTLAKKERKYLGIGKDRGVATLKAGAMGGSKNARFSPLKVRQELDLIRGKDLEEALAIVKFTPRGASRSIYKLLKSAEANAVNNNGLNKDLLYVAEAYADNGPIMKRIMPRARGSADRIDKRTTNITVVLKERK